jgi:hypothetical protein
MIDHNIILQILYHNALERQVFSYRTKKECSDKGSFIFFPVEQSGYSARLNGLDSVHYMQRLAILYSMLWNCN